MNDISLMAIDLAEIPNNKSLSSRETDNDNKIIVLLGATLIDGTGSPPKSDIVSAEWEV